MLSVTDQFDRLSPQAVLLALISMHGVRLQANLIPIFIKKY